MYRIMHPSLMSSLDTHVLTGLTEKVHPGFKFNFKFPECEQLPPPILSFEKVGFAYSGKKEDMLYNHVSAWVVCWCFVVAVSCVGAASSHVHTTRAAMVRGVSVMSCMSSHRHPSHNAR